MADAQRIEAEDWQIRGVLETALDCIVMMDAQGRIVAFNPAAEKTFGYTREEVLGQPLGDAIVPPSLRAAHDAGLATYLASGKGPVLGQRIEIVGMRKDGSEFPVELAITPFVREGAPVFVAYLRDITERKQAEESLKAFAERLQATNRELEDFAFVASHDLQEPLRKVQAFGDRLRTRCEADLSDRGKDYLARMLGATGRMSQLITDLLSYSRVTTKGAPFEPVDLAEVVRGVLSDLEIRIQEQNAVVEIGDLPTLDGDATQMRQLLQNLIGNALKFHAPDTPPRVEVRAEVVEDAGSLARHQAGCFDEAQAPVGRLWRLTVRDHGIGFEAEYAEKIFTMFQRLHGRSEYQGTGVGLAICRRIVERHHGRIEAEARPGEGALFTILLPETQAVETVTEEVADAA